MKAKVFIDTNVMLDLLGEREPYYSDIAKIATLADKGEIAMIASSLSYAIVFYLLSKNESAIKVKEKLRNFKIISEIAQLDDLVIEKGLNSNFTDFEDALQYNCTLQSECDILITHNQKDFKNCILVIDKVQLLFKYHQEKLGVKINHLKKLNYLFVICLSYEYPNEHIKFWQQLKAGYDQFNLTQQDLNIAVVKGKYVIY
jgi:predicted nucleic acid-binding protein